MYVVSASDKTCTEDRALLLLGIRIASTNTFSNKFDLIKAY